MKKTHVKPQTKAPVKKAPIAQPKVDVPKAGTQTKKPVLPAPKTQTKPLPKANPPKQLPQQQGWLARMGSQAVSGIGSFTGAVVGAAGNGIVGAGRGAGSSLANTSRGWGDAIREYGNSIKDVTGASGPRASSAKNPLGLSSTPQGAKAVMGSRPGISGVSKGSGSNPLGL
ncbi:hypothetical protein BU23DRAFT_457405 [Bimuria novae-zelandiae CBS 107.79]|uniref:Uncharacterized protein n=1 Tax=Bimuria novae-zelandiae CBS 107.79 TaxID=1447943 RepID=A0A6A5VGK3_9PLEO|nr:hypothetical protein BU23DRAFT_457405 [Bimuria novae-zelandiae CBS 107.79]